MMFFFFLINCLLIIFVIHMFNYTAELAILVEILTKEAESEIATHSVIAKISD